MFTLIVFSSCGAIIVIDLLLEATVHVFKNVDIFYCCY